MLCRTLSSTTAKKAAVTCSFSSTTILSSSSSSMMMMRPTKPLLFVMNPELMKKSASTQRSGVFGDIDPERMKQFEEMQMGMTKKKIEQDRKEKQDFLDLPREVQVRKWMLSKRKFDVDLVRKNGMNVAEEFQKFKADVKAADRAANRGFWVPIIVSTVTIWGGASYWVFWWY